MARIGVSKSSGKTRKTVNKAGGVAYDVADPSLRLIHIIGSMFNEPTYYKDDEPGPLTSEAQAVIDTAKEIALSKNWANLLPIAAWARTDLLMRTTPTVVFAVAAEFLPKNPLAKREDGRAHLRVYAKSILQRADEPRNAVAAWRALFGQTDAGGLRTSMVPNSLKRAVADRLLELPEHLLAKYDSPGRPSMADVIRLSMGAMRGKSIRGVPKLLHFVDREAWLKVCEATPALKARYDLARVEDFKDPRVADLIKTARASWEDIVSQFGSNPSVWEYALPQMGYMALMRNLRNLAEAGIDLKKAGVLKKLCDADEVRNSKQLPFRFFSAARIFDPSLGEGRSGYGGYYGRGAGVRTLEDNAQASAIVNALDAALNTSIENLPVIPDDTAIFVDTSGSMYTPISDRSSVSAMSAAALLGAIFAKRSPNAYLYAFGTSVGEVPFRAGDGVLTIMEKIAQTQVGMSTNFHLAPGKLIAQKRKVGRIIMISDMQCWDSGGYGYGSSGSVPAEFAKYKAWAGGNVWLHSVNVMGTPQAQADTGMSAAEAQKKQVNLLSGFSDKTALLICSAEGIVDGVKSDERAIPSLNDIMERFAL